MSVSPPRPALEPVFDVVVHLGPMEDHGITRSGHRRVIPIEGGEITGAVAASILAGGADWQIARPDGSLEIDGRYSARTDSGDLIHLRVAGVRTGPPDVLDALLRGDEVDPSSYYFRTALTIETSAPSLSHLQQSIFVTSCIREAATVRYTAYRVS